MSSECMPDEHKWHFVREIETGASDRVFEFVCEYCGKIKRVEENSQ